MIPDPKPIYPSQTVAVSIFFSDCCEGESEDVMEPTEEQSSKLQAEELGKHVPNAIYALLRVQLGKLSAILEWVSNGMCDDPVEELDNLTKTTKEAIKLAKSAPDGDTKRKVLLHLMDTEQKLNRWKDVVERETGDEAAQHQALFGIKRVFDALGEGFDRVTREIKLIQETDQPDGNKTTQQPADDETPEQQKGQGESGIPGGSSQSPSNKPTPPHELKQIAYVLNVRSGITQKKVAERMEGLAKKWAKDNDKDLPDHLYMWDQQKVSRAKGKVEEFLSDGGSLTIAAGEISQAASEIKDRKTESMDPQLMDEMFSG